MIASIPSAYVEFDPEEDTASLEEFLKKFTPKRRRTIELILTSEPSEWKEISGSKLTRKGDLVR